MSPRFGGDARRALTRQSRRLRAWVGCDIELWLVDDTSMTELCEAHLGKRKTTDVLSFSPDAPLPGLHDPASGQIAINLDALVRQAPGVDERSRLAEASSLLIHGAAHLAGHDHATRTEARAMLRLEVRLARRLGATWLPRPYGRLL